MTSRKTGKDKNYIQENQGTFLERILKERREAVKTRAQKHRLSQKRIFEWSPLLQFQSHIHHHL